MKTNIKVEIKKFDFNNSTISKMLTLCLKVRSKEDANDILERYKKINKHAESNLGYIFGYCGKDERERLYRLFAVNHPIFGSGFGRGQDPTPKEAFKKGVEIARSNRDVV